MTDHILMGDYSLEKETEEFIINFNYNVDQFPFSWQLCSRIADFLVNYMASSLGSIFEISDKDDVEGSLSYILNELVENVFKFNLRGEVEVGIFNTNDQIVLMLRNNISQEGFDKFKTVIEDITSGDPGELLIQKVEENVENDTDNSSGLGYLSIMSDYEASLGWKFVQDDLNKDHYKVYTMSCLTIN